MIQDEHERQVTCEGQSRSYLIFNEFAKAATEDGLSDVNLEVHEEMEQVSRVVVEVAEDRLPLLHPSNRHDCG